MNADEIKALITRLENNDPTLTELSFHHDSTLGDAEIQRITEALKTNTHLLELRLSHKTSLTPLQVEALADALKVNKTLYDLDLSFNALDANSMVSLEQALSKNSTLRVLDLSHCKIDPTGATSLARALAINSTLLELSLKGNDKMLAGKSMAAALIPNKTLKALDLSFCPMDEDMLQSLAEMLQKNQSLQTLEMDGCMVLHQKSAKQGLQKLTQALKSDKTRLKVLSCTHNDLTEAELKEFVSVLETNTSLNDLNVHNSYYKNVPPAGIEDALKSAATKSKALYKLCFTELSKPIFYDAKKELTSVFDDAIQAASAGFVDDGSEHSKHKKTFIAEITNLKQAALDNVDLKDPESFTKLAHATRTLAEQVGTNTVNSADLAFYQKKCDHFKYKSDETDNSLKAMLVILTAIGGAVVGMIAGFAVGGALGAAVGAAAGFGIGAAIGVGLCFWMDRQFNPLDSSLRRVDESTKKLITPAPGI